MTFASSRRAALLGLALVASGCDLVDLVSNDAPRFEETWNMPGPDTRMSVANLLPAGNKVTILPDSSGFSISMDSTTFSAPLDASNCAACQALNGTSAIKPAFTMQPGNSTTLPNDIVSAAITAGQIVIKLNNGLTFDPLYVNTGGGSPPQGHLVIVVRSGSVVLGKDSIRGAAAVSGVNMPFNPGTTLTRIINLTTGTVTNNITVDVSVNSPIGDHPVPIDVTKSFTASATVPSITVASVQMKVTNRTFDTGGADSISMPATGDMVVGLGLDMTITNPFTNVIGTLNMVFAWGPGPTQQVTKPISLPSGTALRSVVLDSTETQALLNGGDNVSIKLNGSVSTPVGSTVLVTPKMEVKVANRMIVKIRMPSEK